MYFLYLEIPLYFNVPLYLDVPLLNNILYLAYLMLYDDKLM